MAEDKLVVFAFLKRALIGEVVHVAEVRAERARRPSMRLKLKRDRRTGRPYGVLKVTAFGSAVYQELSADDIHAWSDALRSTEAAMKAHFGPWQ